MLNNLRAKIFRFCDLSLDAFLEIWKWKKEPFGFDMKTLNDPAIRVACATNDVGESITFCAIENAYVIQHLAVNPSATEVEIDRSHNLIMARVVHDAALKGATKLLMVIPDQMRSIPGEEFIRVVRQPIISAATTHEVGTRPTPLQVGLVN